MTLCCRSRLAVARSALGPVPDKPLDVAENFMNVEVADQSRVEVRRELLQILKGILRDDITHLQLNDDLPIAAQVTLDSMDFLDFVIEIRKHLRVEIPEEEYGKLASIRDFIDYVHGNVIHSVPSSAPSD